MTKRQYVELMVRRYADAKTQAERDKCLAQILEHVPREQGDL